MSSDQTRGPDEETRTNWVSNLNDEVTAEADTATPHEEEAVSSGQSETPRLSIPGSELGGYSIEGELGRGGMGVVYRAFDPRLRRRVALKLMLHIASASTLRQFRDEAQVTAQLQHPSIVPIYDVGQTNSGEIYYTMRLVRGPTLKQLVDEYRTRVAGGEAETPEGWTLFKLLQVFVTVCRSVSYAHDRGVVHLDLKPSNVMIGDYGEVNVLDWGLAKVLGRSAREDPTGPRASPPSDRFFREGVVQAEPAQHTTRAGTTVGTPAYMAPEQASGRSQEVGFSADVYCLGGILHYILTGRPPRDGSPSDVLEQLASRRSPPQPRALEPHVSPDLDRLCTSALVSEPSERLGSATLFADAVEGYLEGRSLSEPRAQDAEFLRGYSSRHYRRPSVTVDVAVMNVPASGAAKVALLHRNQPPFVGAWACPGTFVRLEESLEETAKRVLRDKVGDPQPIAIEQIGAFGDPERDPRTRVITVAYLALVETPFGLPDGPSQLAWFDIGEGETQIILRAADTTVESREDVELAFDHRDLLLEAIRVAKQAE